MVGSSKIQSKQDQKKISILDFNVVNGAQTIGTIYNQLKDTDDSLIKGQVFRKINLTGKLRKRT
jgi:hypothetical protein